MIPPPINISVQIHVDASNSDAIEQLQAIQAAAAGDAVAEADQRGFIRGQDHGRFEVLDSIMDTTVATLREMADEEEQLETQAVATAQNIAESGGAGGDQERAARSRGDRHATRRHAYRHVAEMIEQAVRIRQRELIAADAVERLGLDAAAAQQHAIDAVERIQTAGVSVVDAMQEVQP